MPTRHSFLPSPARGGFGTAEGSPSGFPELLVSLGHEVKVAYDGVTGLSIDQSWDPDVVFLDLGLPTMDGYEVAGGSAPGGPESCELSRLPGSGGRPTWCAAATPAASTTW